MPAELVGAVHDVPPELGQRVAGALGLVEGVEEVAQVVHGLPLRRLDAAAAHLVDVQAQVHLLAEVGHVSVFLCHAARVAQIELLDEAQVREERHLCGELAAEVEYEGLCAFGACVW